MRIGKYKTLNGCDAEVLFKDVCSSNWVGFVELPSGRSLCQWHNNGKAISFPNLSLKIEPIFGYYLLGEDAVSGLYYNCIEHFYDQVLKRGDEYYLRVELTENLKPIWPTLRVLKSKDFNNVHIQSKANSSS